MSQQPIPFPEEFFSRHMEKFRNEPFYSSLDYWLKTGKVTGALLIEVREMLDGFAQQHLNNAADSVVAGAKIRHIPPTMTNIHGVIIDEASIRDSYKLNRS